MSGFPYTVTFYERKHTDRRIVAVLGETPPTPSLGGGGWQQVTLPKRAAVTVWQGRDQLLQMEIPIVLGTMIHGEPLNLDQNALIRMWRPSDTTDEPPVIKLSSPGGAVPFQRLAWVITDLQWGDAQADSIGRRHLQKLTVVVTEYRADEQLQIAKHKKKKPKKWHSNQHARHGDTLRTIAKQHDIPGGWQELAAAQTPPLTDPNQLQVGQLIRIPGQQA